MHVMKTAAALAVFSINHAVHALDANTSNLRNITINPIVAGAFEHMFQTVAQMARCIRILQTACYTLKTCLGVN